MQALWTRLAATAALALSAALASAAELPDFTQLVEKNGTAVVNVQARHTGQEPPDRSADQSGGDDSDDSDEQQQVPEIFRRFFGQPGVPGGPGSPRGFDPTRTSLGSGFIISGDGYILTNNHVVDGADQVSVRLSDRRELDAKVIGADAQYDIALLKVDASGLPSVAIGDSNKLKPGQWVLAIGSPFGFDHSVTSGIVSAVSRTFGGRDQQYVPFIQTDVAINRGNSGGPLFNMDGQVVGINSQIFSNTGGFMGVSFAIPIDVAMNAVQQIKEKGFVSRGMIGVQIQEVDRERAKALGMPRSGGALVNQITPGSAAEKAGVQLGDVIQSFNGVDIVQSADLPPVVGAARPGSKAEISVFRDGKTLSLPLTVGEAPRDGKAVASAGKTKPDAVINPLGIAVEELTADQRKQLQLKDEGVLVNRVTGAAKRSSVQPGDVVLMVGRTKVKNPAEFNAAVKDVKPGDSVMLLVRRDQVTNFVAVTVPKDKG
jgi:serine protease Do